MAKPLHLPFRLGPWTVQPDLLRLTGPSEVDGDDECRLVGHKVMALLVCLASRSGQVVSKETLIAEVWDGAFTSDETLTTAVYELRKALDDSARQPRFVETIRKGGYRLVAPVELLESVAPVESPSPVETPSEASPPEPSADSPSDPPQTPRSEEVLLPSDAPAAVETRRPRHLRVGLLATAALVLLLLGSWLWRSTSSTPPGEIDDRLAADGTSSVEAAPEDATAGLASLAVLPLTHFGETCGEDAFTGGLTDMLVVDLAAEVPLEVLPSLVTRGHGERWNLQDVTEELDADLVIEGSVVRSSERIWLSVQLVDTSSGKLLWGGSYERSMDDPLLVQRDLAASIAGEVHRIVVEAASSAAASSDTAVPPLEGDSSVSLPGR